MPKNPKGVSIEYANLKDLPPPSCVQGAQGGVTSDGLLQVLLYSEMQKAAEIVNVEGTAKGTVIEVNLDKLDPYPLDEQEYVRVVRHIQANLLLSPKAVSDLATWLQGKLQEMNLREA